MANIEYNIFKIQPGELTGFLQLSDEDINIITSAEVTRTFKPGNNFIEANFFTLDGIRLQTIPNYTNYSILTGDTKDKLGGTSEISIDVQQDYLSYGYQGEEVKVLYNFLNYPYSNTTTPQDFYIESISPDRTEVRLVSINLGAGEVQEVTNSLIKQFSSEAFLPELYVYFGSNIFLSIVNIDLEEFRDTNAVLIKLYEPLPINVNVKRRINIVEKVSDSVAFEINTTIIPEQEEIPTLRGANFAVEVETQSTEPSEYFNFQELFSFPTTNTYRELSSILGEKGAELSIEYSNYEEFTNFSSAEERLRNFKYKLDLINHYQQQLDIIQAPGFIYSGTGKEGSVKLFTDSIQGILRNFDHYERHLYFENTPSSWPKANTAKPYINLPSTSGQAITWFNQKLQEAVLYDAQNPNILVNTVPAYLKEDENNRPYELFIHMVGQHFDNIWIYTDAVTKKYDADNRLNKGVSKDLIEDLLKNFGIKLYTSNRSTQDLFRYFTSNTYEVVETEPLIQAIITGSDNTTSQNDYQKEIYKRIYHNLPLLMKSKGTERGLRALINCFGIPSDVLDIRTYGGRLSTDLPFFGEWQAFTSSLDKVRIDNTGSIVEGNTLSYYTSILQNDEYYTKDQHTIEVGFSPSHNIDQYIISQSAVLFPNNPFNIDQYIGDPRQGQTSQYLELRKYANEILDGTQPYDLRDFIRLIKFFDNVLFRMIRDFIPARAVADTGVIIKPHILERNKHISPVMSWERPEYEGHLRTGFITGSNPGAYKSVGYGAISSSKFDGESSTAHQLEVVTPAGTKFKTWGQVSNLHFDREQEQAKYDGELSGSIIQVTDGELNRDNPYKKLNYKTVKYDVTFFREVPGNICLIQSRTPFILNPDILSWNLGTFFIHAATQDHDFTVDEQAVPSNEKFSYQFDEQLLTQYNSFDIVGTKPGLTPTCVATTTVRPVRCDMTISGQNPPTVNTVQAYNLLTWFNINSNTQNSILVNGQIILNPTAYTFTQNLGSQVEVMLRDNVDIDCSRVVYVTINNCTIQAKTNPIYAPIQYATGPEVRVTDLFTGFNESTQYKLLLQYKTTSGTVIFSSPIDIINNSSQASDGTVYDNTVPIVKQALYQRYSDNLPANLQGGADGIKGWRISATQPGVLNCTALSVLVPAVNSATQPGERIPVELNFGSTIAQACAGETTVTVFIYSWNDDYTFEDIVEEGVRIYQSEDPEDFTFADAGYYSDSNIYSEWTVTGQIGTWSSSQPIACPTT